MPRNPNLDRSELRTCKRVGCGATFRLSRLGRPKDYCSKECRELAFAQRELSRALEQAVKRDVTPRRRRVHASRK